MRELHALASVVNVEHFKPGDVMIKEGEQNSSIYLVVAGKVTIFVGYGTPDQTEKVTIGEGSFLGRTQPLYTYASQCHLRGGRGCGSVRAAASSVRGNNEGLSADWDQSLPILHDEAQRHHVLIGLRF